MDAKEYIHQQFKSVLRFSDAANQDLTQAQVDWCPPGTANSIGVALLHATNSEDRRIQGDCQGKPTVWETGGWQQKMGLAAPGAGKGFDEARGQKIPLDVLRAYMAAVRAETNAYLNRVTDADLERRVVLRGEEMPVAGVIARVMAHLALHGGDISTLKGLQGSKGLPM